MREGERDSEREKKTNKMAAKYLMEMRELFEILNIVSLKLLSEITYLGWFEIVIAHRRIANIERKGNACTMLVLVIVTKQEMYE